MLPTLITTIVNFSRRFAWGIILLALLLTGVFGWYAATHFEMNADVNQLLADNLPWRQQEKALEKAFPQNVDTLVVVVDGKSADQTETAAAALAERLRAMPQLFTSVVRPDAIPYFRKNGFLFLSKEELGTTLEQLVQAQPLLGMLASDPTLRGLAGMLDLMTQGFQAGQLDYTRLDLPFTKIADVVDASIKGQDKPLELQALAGDGAAPSPRDLRKFIITRPVLNYGELESGKTAEDAIRQTAADMNLTQDKGFTIRLTGSVALNDEEFASVAHGTGLATIVSGVLVFALLLFAMRSLRIVLPILLTLIVGLVATSAFAIAAIGSLNMISVAFAVMFIGIAVDFGIQFGIRYRDQHHQEPDHATAMARTAAIIAVPLTMAAASTALGFLAFIPTAYKGVSELGMIAGAGMLIAFVLNITLLPALLSLTKPPAESEAIGYAWAAPLDAFVLVQRKKILVVTLLLGGGGVGIASRLQFDFDPLNLKDPTTESVSTMFDVMRDPDSGSYAIEVLRPSLQEAQTLADQASKLPEVDHAMTLASFVPEDQTAKLAMIADARMLLDPTMNLPLLPAASTEETNIAIRKLTADLHAIGKDHASAERLATMFEDVIKQNDPQILQRLQTNLVGAMQDHVRMVRELLEAEPITVEGITDDLRRDWLTADGRYRVQIHPKGDARDHKTLIAFTKAVRAIAPDAAGTPISIQESGNTVVSAFIQAGIFALVAISVLAFIVLKNLRDVLILLAPLILAGILTLATIVLIGLPLNFANIIALPLLLSLGVSYAIYFVSYARSGHQYPLQSSMARAVMFSAGTVLVAFGSLALSSHPGTAGMGELLTVSLLYSLLFTFVVLPALLALTKTAKP